MGHGPCPTTYIIIPSLPPRPCRHPVGGSNHTARRLFISPTLNVVYHGADLPPKNKIGMLARGASSNSTRRAGRVCGSGSICSRTLFLAELSSMCISRQYVQCDSWSTCCCLSCQIQLKFIFRPLSLIDLSIFQVLSNSSINNMNRLFYFSIKCIIYFCVLFMFVFYFFCVLFIYFINFCFVFCHF